jgi:hypothetical protein
LAIVLRLKRRYSAVSVVSNSAGSDPDGPLVAVAVDMGVASVAPVGLAVALQLVSGAPERPAPVVCTAFLLVSMMPSLELRAPIYRVLSWLALSSESLD